MNLINKKLLQLKIATHEFPDSEKMANARKLLEGWQKALKDSDLEKTKEKSVQGKFLSTFFEAILGYSDVTTGNEEWTLIQHPRIENDSKEPDGSLGWFTKDKKITRAVIELKDAKTQLDKKQNRGSEKFTPIEQAYLYATKYDGCNWIIVSNFREIRLYNKHKTQEYYEKFDVVDLVQENEFKRFYFLLSKDTLLTKDTESIIDVLAKDTLEAEQDITKKFYAEYKQVRLNLFQHLIDNNQGIEKEILLEKAQKLLDRFIFTLFCEDTSSLLPLNIVKTTYERALNSLSPSDERVWTEFRGLFIAIDKGNERVTPPINAYNGGLFAFDEVLDRLSVKDEFWTQIMRLSEYDFETDLNVNILGHIFEQSISDLESLKSELRGEEQDKKKSKRKKDGIYYTPEYITRYIVENTVGKYLEENPDKLSSIKILDPACGSGAFLNQAHSFLSNEYKVRHEALIAEKQSKGETQTLFDYNPAENNRAILLNNLYGVDLNQESVEITKLALWLKTARKTEPLQNLDKNIKCGNSLIDDPEVAGEKAFNWNYEYKEIIDEGGFDVIIGNPPYVNVEKIEKGSRDYLLKKFKYLKGRFDLYIAFIEKSLGLLNEGGILSFIIPYPFLYEKYGHLIRFHIASLYSVLNLADLSDVKVFEDATVRSLILTLKKKKSLNNPVRVYKYNGINLFYDSNLTLEQNQFLNNPNYSFKLELTSITLPLLNKIKDNSKDLGTYYYINWGCRTGNVQKYVYRENKGFVTEKKMVNGRNINRYTTSWEGDYINYLPNELYNPMFPELFENSKIFIPDITGKKGIIASYDDSGLFAEHTLSIAIRKDRLINVYRNGKSILKINQNLDYENFNEYFILGLLNSKLINYYFKSIYGGGLHVYPKDISSLPIKYVKRLASEINILVEKIIEMNKQLKKKQFDAISLLTANFGLKKEVSLDLGFNELLEALVKQKVSLSLVQKEELQNWYKNKQAEISTLKGQINEIDRKIDELVYELYGLTQEEIDVIEGKDE